MEEAAFMSPEMFSKIVVPLLGVDKTAVLAISTPDDENNYYTVLMKIVVEGKPLFKVIRIGMACEACEAAGVPCSHKVYRLPFWKPQVRQEKIDAIYKNNPELYAREILGQVVSNKEYMCTAPLMRPFKDKQPHKMVYPANVVHIGIDPSGGGTASDYAICSMVYDNGQFVIIGTDASSSFKHNDIMYMLDEHFRRIRKFPQYKDAIFYVYVEANMSFISVDGLNNHFQDHRREFGDVKTVSLDPKNLGRYGVWTGEKEKEAYALNLRKILSDGKLSYADNFISVVRQEQAAKDLLEEQMRQLRKQALESKLEPGFDKVKYTYTGKSHGVRDDACMALQIVAYNCVQMRQNPAFVLECAARGLRY